MKKLLLTITVLSITVIIAKSQSFYLKVADTIIGDSIIVYPSDTASSVIYFTATVHNNTNNGVNLKVVRNEIEMIDGSNSFFKWGGEYYSDTTNLSTNYIYIPAGGSCPDSAFITQFNIGETRGISYIDYTFFDIENPDENVKVVVEYDSFHTPNGIDEDILRNIWVSDIYPNPATNYVDIDYALPIEIKKANIKILNVYGSVVKEKNIDLNNQKMHLNISGLSGGIYFYTIFVNNQILMTKKLIVR